MTATDAPDAVPRVPSQAIVDDGYDHVGGRSRGRSMSEAAAQRPVLQELLTTWARREVDPPPARLRRPGRDRQRQRGIEPRVGATV